MSHLISVELAGIKDLLWCMERLRSGHYLHTGPDPRTRPLAYMVRHLIHGQRIGCLTFGRPESTRCYRGGLTYGSLVDYQTGRADFDRWEVLNLSRLWLAPEVQSGGYWCDPSSIPGFWDRRGVWRPALASAVIRSALDQVGLHYLLAYPPCFVEQPYQIRAVLSYCDTRLHRGYAYRAAGFSLARRNAAGVETWWTPSVRPITEEEDAAIRAEASVNARSVRIREAAAATKGGAL